jgi:signal transduction histidine kinase
VSTRPPLFPRPRLRVRITLAFVGVGLVLAVTLSLATFLGVRSFLVNERVRTSTSQTINTLGAARETLPREASNPDAVIAFLQGRGTFQALITQRDDFFATSLSLTPEAIPPGLRSVVQSERLGYQFTTLNGERVLVYGAPLPPASTDIYLFYPVADVDRTLSVVLRVLTVAGFALVGVAALLAQRVAGRVLRPLADVSTAAQRVAEGLLETRVQAATSDEVGVLAASFNEMAGAFQQMILRERRFVANVSHELRTPLSTLRTASELLASHRDEFSASSREAVDLIAEDVANLRRLVEELMEVSEVDAGKALIRLEEVDLHALSEAVVSKMRRAVPVRGEHVSTHSDKARLERIVSNLIDNAFEHGGGTDVAIGVGRRDGQATLEVSDRGPGIPAEDLPRLFDRFFKADLSRTRERGGIGLGLAIAFENAKLLGGTLEAASDESRTTFTLSVPLRGSEDS